MAASVHIKILFSLTPRHWPATGRPPSRRREGLWFWSARTRRQILLNSCQWSRANLDCSSLHQRNNVGGGGGAAAPELALSQAGVEWRTLAAGYARESERVSSPSPVKFISLMALPPSRLPACSLSCATRSLVIIKTTAVGFDYEYCLCRLRPLWADTRTVAGHFAIIRICRSLSLAHSSQWEQIKSNEICTNLAKTLCASSSLSVMRERPTCSQRYVLVLSRDRTGAI